MPTSNGKITLNLAAGANYLRLSKLLYVSDGEVMIRAPDTFQEPVVVSTPK